MGKISSTKSEIKVHTQIGIATENPTFYRISNANQHDVKAMEWISYETNACYVFDRGHFNLFRLFEIDKNKAVFIIRENFHSDYDVKDGKDLRDCNDNN